MKIKNVVKPKKEVINKELQGVIQSYKVGSDENRVESKPEKFFSSTYPSNAIKNVIERINDKRTHETSKGSFILSGPRGSGKSHALVALYHLFQNPKIASQWLDYWNIDFKKPKEESQSVIVSAQETDPDLLWEPIFKRAGKENLLEKVKRYPTTEIIEELVGDNTFAILLDELGTWWETFDRETDREMIKKNEMFLLALMEVANDKNKQLFVFATSYGKISGLDKTLNRTSPYREDMSSSGDKEKIIFHRLFEKPRKEVNEEKIRNIVKKYTEEYEKPIDISNIRKYEEKFVKSYPFHPQLLEILGAIYEGAKERQNVRGEMRVLSETLSNLYDKTDAILISDLNEKAFRGIDREIVNKFETDVRKRISNIDYGEELLKVILMFSLEGTELAATESDAILGTFKPAEGMTLTQLSMSLENIYGKAQYLHKDDGHYSIKKERNIGALIESEKGNIDEKEVKEEVKKLIKKEIFENQAYIYELEKGNVPDDRKNKKIVVCLKSYGDEKQTKGELESFLKNRTYQNNVIFIVPKNGGPLNDDHLLGKIKNIVAAKSLKLRIDEKTEEINKRIQDEIKEAVSYIKNLYGYWIKWARREKTHEVSIVKKPIKPDIHEIRESIKTDETLLKEFILNEVKGNEKGRKIGSLLQDFKKMRKYPLISEDGVFYNIIKKLNGEDVIIRGDRGKEFWDRDPKGEIKDEWQIIDINFVSPPEIEEPEEELKFTEEEIPQSLEEKRKTKIKRKFARGNSPKVITTKYETTLNEESLENINKIDLNISFKKLGKRGLLELLKKLPDCEFIESEIEVEECED